jgi:hypothetical protein
MLRASWRWSEIVLVFPKVLLGQRSKSHDEATGKTSPNDLREIVRAWPLRNRAPPSRDEMEFQRVRFQTIQQVLANEEAVLGQ